MHFFSTITLFCTLILGSIPATANDSYLEEITPRPDTPRPPQTSVDLAPSDIIDFHTTLQSSGGSNHFDALEADETPVEEEELQPPETTPYPSFLKNTHFCKIAALSILEGTADMAKVALITDITRGDLEGISSAETFFTVFAFIDFFRTILPILVASEFYIDPKEGLLFPFGILTKYANIPAFFLEVGYHTYQLADNPAEFSWPLLACSFMAHTTIAFYVKYLLTKYNHQRRNQIQTAPTPA